MRIVTYDAGRGPRAGVLADDGVIDVWDALGSSGERDPSVRALLDGGGLEAARALMGAKIPLASLRLLPPVPDPGKIICIGLNYGEHAREAGLEPPESPTFFAKFANALAPPGAEVKLPEWSDKVDYEAEVAFVIGTRCKDVSEDQALAHVAGYMLLNDLSARDWQFKTPQWMPGKVFDGAAPCGPALVTQDEAGPPDAIGIKLELNGETMQEATTDDLVFGVTSLVAHLSKLMTLEPGDIVSTGTPSGVGSVREPRVWLKPGDVTTISSPTLGTLETTLV